MSARVCALLVLAIAAGSASAGPVAEASFPGRNGVIAFTDEGPPFEPKPRGEGAWTIRTVNPRSGRTRQLTHVSPRCGRRGWTWADSEPSYSASGRFIVYVHSDECDPGTKDGIYIMRANGTRRRLIHAVFGGDILEFPAFSPSGGHLAFSQYAESTYIMRATRRASERDLSDCPAARCPLSRYAVQVQPVWSPRGRRLALTLSGFEGEEDTGHIGTVDRRGMNLRLVTRSRRDAMPDWSPGAKRIAFHRETFTGRAFQGNVFVAQARRSRHRPPRRLTETHDAFFPVWSPNGRSIAFVRSPDAFSGPGSLWTMRARGGGGQRLVVSRAVSGKTSWQPRPRR